MVGACGRAATASAGVPGGDRMVRGAERATVVVTDLLGSGCPPACRLRCRPVAGPCRRRRAARPGVLAVGHHAAGIPDANVRHTNVPHANVRHANVGHADVD